MRRVARDRGRSLARPNRIYSSYDSCLFVGGRESGLSLAAISRDLAIRFSWPESRVSCAPLAVFQMGNPYVPCVPINPTGLFLACSHSIGYHARCGVASGMEYRTTGDVDFCVTVFRHVAATGE